MFFFAAIVVVIGPTGAKRPPTKEFQCHRL
ncbi:hypothetical protein ABIB17_001445 [Arthrobacter sp. UYEF6]